MVEIWSDKSLILTGTVNVPSVIYPIVSYPSVFDPSVTDHSEINPV